MESLRKSAVVPAFNEAKTIGGVLATLVASKLMDEIIVINDGSSDHTSVVANDFGVTVIDLPQNMGKGHAMDMGIAASSGEVILFLDADLIGLQKHHIEALLHPITAKTAIMTVGKFRSGSFWTALSQHLTPFLSGQRAILRKNLDGLGKLGGAGFGVETAITIYFRKNKFPIQTVLLDKLTHVVKEEKMGIVKGFFSRLKMYRDILMVLFRS